jgi:hypothetical protein
MLTTPKKCGRIVQVRFKENAMEPLKQFLAEAKSADLRDKEMFAFVVREGLTLTGMSVRDAGELFRTAPGTVSRWENGHTAPALVARYAVRDLLVNRVTRIASALDQRVAVPA